MNIISSHTDGGGKSPHPLNEENQPTFGYTGMRYGQNDDTVLCVTLRNAKNYRELVLQRESCD